MAETFRLFPGNTQTKRHRARCAALVVASLCALSACGSPSKTLVEEYAQTNTRSSFILCSNFGCSTRYRTSLSEAEWLEIRAHFQPQAVDPSAERAQMARAIGHIERVIGPKVGTSKDRPGAAIIPLHSRKGQQDCIDEAYNTTTYLQFMERDKLFSWHKTGVPATRGYVVDRWFHNTATVIENDTGDAYVIDSWFGANGEAADVAGLDAWLGGWAPEYFSKRTDR